MIIKDNTTFNYSNKMQKFQDYIESLEEERLKIQVFEREFPLSLHLVSLAIEKCKKELYSQEHSECSEQTSTDGPILENFMPMKGASSKEQDGQHSKETTISSNNTTNRTEILSRKSDWLKSVQLWNQPPNPPTKEDSPRKVSVVEVNKNGNGDAFQPFKREEKRMVVEVPPTADASSTAGTGGSGGGCKVEDKEGYHRKARRCWSPELHRRFLQSLQQLGGAHVATPKQITELMKVDGLTNDEVKSHLQKYRLHTRRPGTSIPSNNRQAPQFVVVGGIWMPPPLKYTSTVATSGKVGTVKSSPPDGIYAPKATLGKALTGEATRKQRQESETNYSEKKGSYSNTISHSRSPSTLSSIHTSTSHGF